MKYFVINIIILIVLTSCKAPVPFVLLEPVQHEVKPEANNYPDNGVYSIELIPNKSFVLTTGKSGRAYPSIAQGTHILLKFTYTKKANPEIQDSGYREVIYANLGPTLKNLDLKDTELAQVSLSFGRLCFCGDQTGYWPVQNGKITVIQEQPDKVHISLEFKVKEAPQIIKKISETIRIPKKYLAPQ